MARADSRAILNDTRTGSGVPIVITPPGQAARALTGWSNDIGLLVDPDTGQAISGRVATVAVHIADLAAEGLPIPEAEHRQDAKPWSLSFKDEQDNDYTFRIAETHPDRTMGIVTFTVDSYRRL